MNAAGDGVIGIKAAGVGARRRTHGLGGLSKVLCIAQHGITQGNAIIQAAIQWETIFAIQPLFTVQLILGEGVRFLWLGSRGGRGLGGLARALGGSCLAGRFVRLLGFVLFPCHDPLDSLHGEQQELPPIFVGLDVPAYTLMGLLGRDAIPTLSLPLHGADLCLGVRGENGIVQ